MAGINHQPFKIPVIAEDLQQPGPHAPVTPGLEALEDRIPIAIIGRNVAPGQPVRSFHKTAFKSNRVSSPLRPGLPFVPGKWGLSFNHTSSLIS